MRILLIDYSGHPFQVQLSRALASAGHETLHLYTGSSETPKGDLVKNSADSELFDVKMVKLSESFNKTNFFKRFVQERQIGRLFADEVVAFQPDVLICANCPIETLKAVRKAQKEVGAKFVFWVQDLLGEAASRVLGKKLGVLGNIVGMYFEDQEQALLKSADHVVAIAEDFRAALVERYQVQSTDITVIENWSPIDDIPALDRENDWARDNLPPADFRIVYSGTLGFKQDPELLLNLAREIECDLYVFSEGVVANQLAADAQSMGIENLYVRPWLDFGDLPSALGSADLLVVLLEPDAGAFSVPSKVLTYLCAARPILGSIDPTNLAAKIIARNGAGMVAPPGNHADLIAAAKNFKNDPQVAQAAGMAGRKYAEETFDISRISKRFLNIIENMT